jgi:hypothetical protein
MQDYTQQTESQEVKYWINHNLTNYLKKNPENVGEIEHILDFLNSDKAPNRLRKMSYEQAKKGSEQWIKTMNKQARDIVETEEDTEIEIDFEDGMRLVRLVGKEAFQREGKLMSHCVSSYHDKSDIKVYSLRDSKNNPHCTIEVVSSGSVNQIKGKGNGSIHPNYIKYVMSTLKHFGTDVRDSEMSNLGYSSLGVEETEFLRTHFKKLKTITFNDKVYIYNHQKFERI